MFQLREAIQRYLDDSGKAPPPIDLSTLGGQPPDDHARNLIDRLKSGGRGLEVYFVVCVAMIVFLFVVQIFIIFLMRENAAAAGAAIGTFGITASGLITVMIRLWRDRDRVMTMIILAETLGPQDLRTVLRSLVNDHFRATTPAGAPEP